MAGALRVGRGGPIAHQNALAKSSSCEKRISAYISDIMTSFSHHLRHSPDGMPPIAHARFAIGDVVRHRLFDFRGVVFDIDPVFANSEEWYAAIPEDARPRRDQPFYHLLAENDDGSYVAYVSQQNLISDQSDEPVNHPGLPSMFDGYRDGRYKLKSIRRH
jgi:heat shock protein HspQ